MKKYYTLDELSKMVKKNYLDSLPANVVEMQREIERLRTEVMDLKARNESLEKTIVNDKFNVEVDSEWDLYSGQREHYHKTDISWNEDE